MEGVVEVGREDSREAYGVIERILVPCIIVYINIRAISKSSFNCVPKTSFWWTGEHDPLL